MSLLIDELYTKQSIANLVPRLSAISLCSWEKDPGCGWSRDHLWQKLFPPGIAISLYETSHISTTEGIYQERKNANDHCLQGLEAPVE